MQFVVFFYLEIVLSKKKKKAVKSAHSSSDSLYALRGSSSHTVARKAPTTYQKILLGK